MGGRASQPVLCPVCQRRFGAVRCSTWLDVVLAKSCAGGESALLRALMPAFPGARCKRSASRYPIGSVYEFIDLSFCFLSRAFGQ